MEESTSSSTAHGGSDIYQQVVDRYSDSVAPLHRNLCATAKKIHSTIILKSLHPNPLSYFDTIIATLSDTCETTRDADEVAALSLFLEFVLPLVSKELIDMSKAYHAALIVVEGLGVSNVPALVQCLGMILDFCDLDNWNSAELGFFILMKYSRDKCPQVRDRAQDCVLKVFKSFQSHDVKKSAGNLVVKSVQNYLSDAVHKASCLGLRSTDRLVDEVSKFLHTLHVLEILIPCLPSDVMLEAIKVLDASINTRISILTTHGLDILEAMLEFFESESKPTIIETIKISDKWESHYSSVIGYIAGLLICENNAKRPSNILIAMIKRVHVYEDSSKIVKSLCNALVEVVTHKRSPNDHTLTVISEVFLELGRRSSIYMGKILVKLASFMPNASSNVKHCIGCAIVGMKPDKVQVLIPPISVDVNASTCCNTWLIPLFKDYVIGSSLEYFIETVVPLSQLFEKACQKVPRNSVIRQRLKSHARDCWGLLPAFCRHPNDLHGKFGSLADLMLSYIKRDAFMLEDIAIALQHLVKRNKNMSFLGDDEASKLLKLEYDEETATRNIEVLSASSQELLKAFTKILFQVSYEKRGFVKETIGCLALVTESSAVRTIFFSALKKIVSTDRPSNKNNKNALLLELASAFGGAINIDPIDYIYNSIKQCLEEEPEDGDAYANLYIVLGESLEFMSTKFKQLMDLLLSLKPPTVNMTSPEHEWRLTLTSLESRLLCVSTLLAYSIEITRTGENIYGLRMLHEILVLPEDSNEEIRKVAAKVLLQTKSILLTASCSSEIGGLYYEFISMIMWFVYESPPHIKCDVVSALSILIDDDKDSEICNVMPDIVPAILQLLDGENNIQVIKAALRFIHVLVLRLQVRDLQKFLSDIFRALLPWSTVSQPDVTSKMKIILETMQLKCGSALVKSHVPEKYRDFVENYFGGFLNPRSS